MKITTVKMDKANRKLGLRGGLDKVVAFLRLDLWGIGFRLAADENEAERDDQNPLWFRATLWDAIKASNPFYVNGYNVDIRAIWDEQCFPRLASKEIFPSPGPELNDQIAISLPQVDPPVELNTYRFRKSAEILISNNGVAYVVDMDGRTVQMKFRNDRPLAASDLKS